MKKTMVKGLVLSFFRRLFREQISPDVPVSAVDIFFFQSHP
jgi:hypothetical protein